VYDKVIWRHIQWIFPLTVLIVFSLFVLALVFSVGVGFADDAYHAVIAKNLANGLGYTSTIQDGRADFSALQFDPRVGVGPTIIFPASLIIKIFGNTYWAPGLANILLWTLLCGVIGLLIRKYQSGIGLSLATLSFFYLGFALTTFHFWQWYALLGEIPAALLIILSVLIFLYKGSRLCRFLAGTAMALAVQAKLLSFLAFAALLLVAIIFYALNRSKREPDRQESIIANNIYLIIGFVIPLLAFEMWKLFSLGASGYVNNWKSYLAFLKEKGMAQGQTLSVLTLYKRGAVTLREGFGISLQSVAFMLAVAGLLVSKDKALQRIHIIFVFMIIFYLFWWIFLSIGWVRYFVIPLILIIAAVSLPFFTAYYRKWLWLYVVLIIIWPVGVWDRLSYPFSNMDSGYFKPTKRTEALLKTSNILSRANRKERVFTQWWATAANLEYISDSHLIFTTYRDETRKHTRPFWIAADTNFVDKNDKGFRDLLDDCSGLSKVGDYVVGRCE